MSDMHVRLEGYWKKRLRLRAMENAEDEEYRWLTTVNLCDYAILVVVDQLMNVTGVILLESMNATRKLCQVKKDATGANATNGGAEGTSTKVNVAQTPLQCS